MRILVVESEARAVRVLKKGLEANSFAVDLSRDGEDGLQLATEIDYDAVIIGAALPRLDGITVVKRLRTAGERVPVLMLGKHADVSAIVQGLEAGADDYVAKPFAFEELMARVHALLRRPPEATDKLRVDELELDRARGTVTRAGKVIRLTSREFGVLEYLMRNAGRVVTRNMILGQVWEPGHEGQTNIVEVYVNYLRAKVDRGFGTRLIHTERGAGYILQRSGPCGTIMNFPAAPQELQTRMTMRPGLQATNPGRWRRAPALQDGSKHFLGGRRLLYVRFLIAVDPIMMDDFGDVFIV